MLSLFLKKTWDFLKPHVPVILITLLFVAACHIVYRRLVGLDAANAGYAEKLNKMQKIHDEELRKIISAQETERKEHKENLESLQKTLDSVKLDHDNRIKELEINKIKKADGLVGTWKTDPTGVAMAKKIGEITGIKVVLPGEVK